MFKFSIVWTNLSSCVVNLYFWMFEIWQDGLFMLFIFKKYLRLFMLSVSDELRCSCSHDSLVVRSSKDWVVVLTKYYPKSNLLLVKYNKTLQEQEFLPQVEGTVIMRSWNVDLHLIQLFFLQILGKLYFFSDGILFCDPHHGSISISKSHMSSISLYDGVSILCLLSVTKFTSVFSSDSVGSWCKV